MILKVGGEYQLTTALENLRQKEQKFSLGKVDDWMDCGKKCNRRNQRKNSCLRKKKKWLLHQHQLSLKTALLFRLVLLVKM